jgi:membrane protein required for colicin V production
MDYADITVLVIVAVSILVGAVRGFIKEVFSLAVWAAAFVFAYYYSGTLAVEMESLVELPSARLALAFAALFVGILLVGGLLTYLIGQLVEKTGLSGTDRLLGGVFGGLRGLFIILFLILATGLTPVLQDPWWQQSRMIQSLLPLAQWSARFLPESIREYIDFTVDQKQNELPDTGETNA